MSVFGSRNPYQRPSVGSSLMRRFVIFVVLAAIPIGGILIKGCQEGPFGRKQVVALNPEQEEALGMQAFKEVLAQEKVVRQGPLVDMIRQIAMRLTKAAEQDHFLTDVQLPKQEMQWMVEVVDSEQQNAFCLPGGKIVVYTGILPIAETDAGLAVVLAHEVSHALGRHYGSERMAQQQMAQAGMMAAGGAMGDMDPSQRMAVMRAINAGAQFGILKYSRDHESEADHMGLLLMATAGYDPREAAKFWERMRKFTGDAQQSAFLSTHPSHDTRIRDLEMWTPEAMKLYELSPEKHAPRPLPDAGFRGARRPAAFTR